jgi:hypothetical protein
MIAPSLRALLALVCLAAPLTSRADVAWLDFQSPDSPTAPLHQNGPAAHGAELAVGPVIFTLLGEGIASRTREHPDALIRDFVYLDGAAATLTLRISGLPAGSYVVESWHFDPAYPGAISISHTRVGEPAAVLVPQHTFATTPAVYTLRSDGVTTCELQFQECNNDDRVRLNGLRIRPAGATSSPPGRFVDIDYANTSSLSAHPDPFFTTDATDPGFRGGPLWRLRTGFGFGNRDILEKDANDGVGNAAALVTIARDLPVGATYGVYVAYISSPGENWQVKAGLSPDKLTTFTPKAPAGRVVDLGLSGESGSNRHQYLGFVGNLVVGPERALWLYSDDGDGVDRSWRNRTWLDGFFLGAPSLEK